MTINAKSQPEARSAPSLRKSTAGYEFDEDSDSWRLDGSISVRLTFLAEMGVDSKVAKGYRMALSRYAQDFQSGSVSGVNTATKKFLRVTSAGNFSAEALSQFRAGLDDEHHADLGRLRSFLEYWYEWGFPGITKRAVDYLETLTLKGARKGVAVLTNCPYSGPYTDIEQQSLINGLALAYSEKLVSQNDYSFLLAVSMTGRRPRQIRHLKHCDLGFTDHEDGTRSYHLDIPRAKQRGDGAFRANFKRVSICKDLFNALDDQRNSVARWVTSTLGEVDEGTQSMLPLFPQCHRLSDCSISDALELLRIDYLHITEEAAYQIARRVNRSVDAHSERTGDRLIVGFTRLRRTFATNLAREGFGKAVIAEALDHSDTQNVVIYARPENETAKVVDKVMATVLAPLAMAFAGTLVDEERDALRGADPHSRVKLKTEVAVGSCGTSQFCADGWKSCYICKKFQPWLHGPHHQALNELLAERKKQEDAGVSKKVISASDRTLLAITQVIQMCTARKAELRTIEGVCSHE